jgi:hypothetical protein
LWTARPGLGLALRATDAFLIPFSLLWCGFAVFWEATVLRVHAPLVFPIFGSVFVAVGLYFVFGRFLADAWARRRTLYAVTDRRIVIVSGVLRRQVRSLFLEGLAEVNLTARRNGKGTLTFGRDTNPWGPMNAGFLARSNAPAFELIETPQQVLSMIRGAQRALSGRP